jgi:hypothetical protein
MRAGSALITGAFWVSLLTAQEVHLKDGRVLTGAVSQAGERVEVATADGPVTVDRAEVDSVRGKEALEAELAGLASRTRHEDAHGQLELARLARHRGLDAAMWRHLDYAVAACGPRDSAVRRRLDSFLGGLERDLLPERLREADVDARVQELLYRVRRDQSPAKIAAVEAVLRQLAGAEPALRARARDAGQAAQRETALRALWHRDAEDERRFVYRTAVFEREGQVRADTMNMVAKAGRADDAVQYLAPGLGSPHPEVRMRTAIAYANLGSPAAVPILVAAGPQAAGSAGATRGHVAFLEQEAYVRDFDVEVAQAAFIADPKIDVLQSGSVFDATVHATQLVRTQIVGAYRTALRSLTGSDPGPRTSAWAGWLEQLPRAARARPAVAEATPTPAAEPPRPAAPPGSGGDDDDNTSAPPSAGLPPPSGGVTVGAPVGGPPGQTSPAGGVGNQPVAVPGTPVLPGR